MLKSQLVIFAMACGAAAGLPAMAATPAPPTTAPATRPATKPAELVYSFEDGKVAVFTAENVDDGPKVVSEKATEGRKSLAIEFTGSRPTLWANDVAAFRGAKALVFDVAYSGDAPGKAKIRVKVRDEDGNDCNVEAPLIEGTLRFTVPLHLITTAKLDSFKVTLDNYNDKQGKLFFDNFRIER